MGLDLGAKELHKVWGSTMAHHDLWLTNVSCGHLASCQSKKVTKTVPVLVSSLDKLLQGMGGLSISSVVLWSWCRLPILILSTRNSSAILVPPESACKDTLKVFEKGIINNEEIHLTKKVHRDIECTDLFELVFLGFFRYTPWSRSVGSYDSSIFSFLRNFHDVLLCDCTNLHSRQLSTRASFSPHLCQHLYFQTFWFDDSHSDGYEVISSCDFDFHFFDV